MRNILIIITVFLTTIMLHAGQRDDQVFSEPARRDILSKLGDLLARNYVNAAIGDSCRSFLNQDEIFNHLLSIEHPRAFVREVNQSLQNIHRDKHLRLSFIPPEERKLKSEQPEISILLQTLDSQMSNYGFQAVEILTDNIGYINLTSFSPVELAREKIVNILGFLSNCEALIIDLRENRGGDLGMVCYLASFFFREKTLFSSYYWRRGDYIEEFRTKPDSSRSAFSEIPFFILTSKKTFSAAEDFANGMKNHKRALLIGEVTGGGAHPGFTFSVNSGFSVFIPTGKAVDPIHGGNWEQTGVEPDIRTSASNAYNIALEKAAFAARSVRSETYDKIIDQYWDLVTELNKLAGTEAHQTGLLNSMLDRLVSRNLLDEWTINRLGYFYMRREEFVSAEFLFQYNLSKFAHSINVYDSMGEFFYRTGNQQQSALYYKKVLSLDPTNQHARYMLDKITK